VATGDDVVRLATQHLGERYLFGVFVPKDNPDWRGPWDCAEFTTWLVYNATGRLYGVADPEGQLAEADAWTGFWLQDADERGSRCSLADAAATPGAFVLRHSARGGHIAVSDGDGGTIEARSSRTGVVRARITGRRWDTGVLVPWIDYAAPAKRPARSPAGPGTVVYRVARPPMKGPTVERIQQALADAGFDPGPRDGVYADLTAAAVRAYQATRGLVVDGEVGPQTARSLGVALEPAPPEK
jgi:N-acetylmuramoyl-L-alanine amidase